MKKITSIMLLLVMLLSTTILASCNIPHKCAPDEVWTFDENAHWHKCAESSLMKLMKASCEEIFDKADHTWNEGVITTVATQEVDGVKTFTCTACATTKTESVPFTGMTEEEWDAIFDSKQFENFTYTETSVLKTTGMTIETISVYEFEKSKGKATATVAGQTESMRLSASETNTYRSSLLDTLEPMVKFEDYKYDAATKTYVLAGEFTITTLGIKADTCVLTFEGGKLVKMVYTCKMVESGMSFDITSTVLFTDYGTTTID